MSESTPVTTSPLTVRYVSVADADAYFSERGSADAWSALSDSDRGKLLTLASGLIADFCVFYDATGYPFTYDSADGMAWLQKAACEEALYLANLGKDPTRPVNVLTLGIVRTDDGTIFDHKFQADILGVSCRRIIEANGGEISPDAVRFPDDTGSIGQTAVVK